ncbi:MAG: lipoprotein [Pseudomonadota bacterium]
MSRRALFLGAAAALLSACGRKAPLRAPEGTPSTYPRPFPPGAPENEDEERL